MNLGNINIQDKLTRAGGIAAGTVATVAINNKLVPMIFKPKDGEPIDTKLSNGLAIAIGLIGPDIIAQNSASKGKGKKSQKNEQTFFHNVGDGIVAAATLNLAEEFFPGFMDKISGVGASGMGPYYEEESLNGYAGDQFDNAVAGQDAYADQDKHVS